MGIQTIDLLGVTMAVLHVAGQGFLEVCVNSRGNRPYSCELRML